MFNKLRCYTERNATSSNLITQLLSVILTNSVPIYGVVSLGWDSFSLVLLFILEGLIVLIIDIIKFQFVKNIKNTLVFEISFILFFGFFVILVYGPYDSLERLIQDRLVLVKDIIKLELIRPLLAITLFRVIRLIQDLINLRVFSGNRKQLVELEGDRWALLLFFIAIVAPFFAHSGPNPFGGLIALALAKIAGEILLIWFSRSNLIKMRSFT